MRCRHHWGAGADDAGRLHHQYYKGKQQAMASFCQGFHQLEISSIYTLPHLLSLCSCKTADPGQLLVWPSAREVSHHPGVRVLECAPTSKTRCSSATSAIVSHPSTASKYPRGGTVKTACCHTPRMPG